MAGGWIGFTDQNKMLSIKYRCRAFASRQLRNSRPTYLGTRRRCAQKPHLLAVLSFSLRFSPKGNVKYATCLEHGDLPFAVCRLALSYRTDSTTMHASKTRGAIGVVKGERIHNNQRLKATPCLSYLNAVRFSVSAVETQFVQGSYPGFPRFSLVRNTQRHNALWNLSAPSSGRVMRLLGGLKVT